MYAFCLTRAYLKAPEKNFKKIIPSVLDSESKASGLSSRNYPLHELVEMRNDIHTNYLHKLHRTSCVALCTNQVLTG